MIVLILLLQIKNFLFYLKFLVLFTMELGSCRHEREVEEIPVVRYNNIWGELLDVLEKLHYQGFLAFLVHYYERSFELRSRRILEILYVLPYYLSREKSS